MDSPERYRISTTDPEVAHAWLREAYSDHRVRLAGSAQDFRFAHDVADFGAFKPGLCRHSMALRGMWSPMGEQLMFAHALSGRFSLACRRGSLDIGPGDVFSFDPDEPMDIGWDDIRVAQVRMDRGAVDRIVAELGDGRAAGRVRFDLARPVDAAAEAQWKRLLRYLCIDAAAGGQPSPLVAGQLFRLVVATALEAFPLVGGQLDVQAGGYASAAAVRRAVAFIDEHAAEDVDLTAIAEAARVGPRALQRAFRRDLDRTPLQYLREIRLARAHEELCATDPATGATVSAVAARWGFGHPGRFATAYRVRFGRSPHETLRAEPSELSVGPSRVNAT